MKLLLTLWFALLLALGTSHAAVLVDQIAVIVGQHVIKASDIDRDIRLTAFLNRQPVDTSAAARRKAADRLVDQEIIRQELSAQGYERASDTDAEKLLQQITADRYQGSASQRAAALARYGISVDTLRDQLLWQLTVLRFIDERFRSGILVTDDEVKADYDQHLADLKKEYPQDFSFATLAPKIRASMEGQRIDKEYDEWLAQAHQRDRIDYKEAAFQ